MKKGISPLLATVILVGLVVTLALITNAFISALSQNQQEKTEATSSCTRASILIDSISCNNGILKAVVSNVGEREVGNFTIYAKINGNILINNTPYVSSNKIGPGEITIVESYTSYSGEVEEVKVYSQECPGIYGYITNASVKVIC